MPFNVEIFSIIFEIAKLIRSHPVREERGLDVVHDGPLVGIDGIGPVVGGISAEGGAYLGLGRDKRIIGREPGTAGVHELNRHSPIRFICDPSPGILSKGVSRLSVRVQHLEGNEFPGTGQFGHRFFAHTVNRFLRRIRVLFARTIANAGAAADGQHNKQA